MSLKNKAVRGASWTAIDVALNQLGMFFVMAYLARLLGPESFGLVGMLAVFVAISQSIVNSGFSQALIQRSKYATEKDFSTAFLVNLGISLGLYLVLFIAAPYIADFYGEDKLLVVSRVLFLILIINAFTVVVNAKLAINLDFKSVTLASSVSTALSAVLGIYLATQGFEHWSLVWMNLTKAALNVIVLWWFCDWLPTFKWSMDSCRRLFGFGSKLMIAGLVAQIVNNLYVLLTGRYFNATQVGFLTQSTELTQRASGAISNVLQKVTYPVLTSVNDDRKRMVSIYKRLIEVSMIVAFPAMVGFSAIADPFVTLFLGSEWDPIVPVITILCFARLITPISSINLNVLNAIGRSDLFLRVDLSKLPMTLVAVFISAPYGVEAIAWAIFITSVISFFINAYYPGKLFGFGALSQLKVGWKLMVATAIMFCSVIIIEHSSPIVEILLKIALGAVVYGGMLFILKVDLFISNVKAAIGFFRR